MTATKRYTRKLLGVLIILFVCVACSVFLVRVTLISKAQPMRISPETTVLVDVEPDGKLPYLQTYLGHVTEIVPPDDDAAVVLARMGSASSLSWHDQIEYAGNRQTRRLDQPHKSYFISPSLLVTILEGEGNERQFGVDNTLTDEQLDEQLTAAMASPWHPEEYPILAEWIQRNDAVLELSVEVCRRSRHTVSPPRSDGRILSWHDQNIERYDELTQLLACRCQSRIAAGQWDLALSDAVACQNLTRLAAQCPGVIHYLQARRMEVRSLRLLSKLTTISAGDNARLAELRQRVEPPSVLPRLADVIDQKERLAFLEVCFMLARFPESKENEVLTADAACLREAARAGTDWNVVMVTVNRQIDELVSILNEPDLAIQSAQLERLTQSLEDKVRESRVSIVRTMLGVAPESEISAARICWLFIPVFAGSAQGEYELLAIQNQTRILIEIHQYKADYGRWPESLSMLVPKYLAEVPPDPKTQQSPEYRAIGDTFILETICVSSNEL